MVPWLRETSKYSFTEVSILYIMVLIRLNGWHAYHMLMILHDTSEIGWLMRAINKKEHRKSIYVSTGSSSEIPSMPQVDHDSCKESTRTSRISLCADSNRKWQRDVIMAARYHWCLKYVMTSCKRSTRTPEIDIRFYMKWHRDIIGIPYIMTGTRWVCLQAWLRVLDARLLQ